MVVSFTRRRFLQATGALAAATLLPRVAAAQAGGARLTLLAGEGGRLVSPQLVGLSYETLQTHDPAFFSADNHALVGLLRGLNPNGVLRIGGNTSDFSVWSEYQDPLPSFPQVAKSPFQRPYVVTPQQLENLAGFLRATGWRLVYGVNLHSDVPEMAAQWAEAVQRAVGDHLLAIQIGNEPDDYHRDEKHKISYDDYQQLWRRSAKAIRQRVSVPIAGPDTGNHTDWVRGFARDEPDLVALSRHYYRSGAKQPQSTVEELLASDAGFLAEVMQLGEAADKRGIPFILTEANSFYNGGKLGISNTFASALWAGDFTLACAQVGMSSLNIHSGVLSVLESSLDIGAAPVADGESFEERLDKISGRYSPIAGDVGVGFYARPIYYGLLLAQQFGGGRFMSVALHADGINLTAYAARKDGRRVIAVFNKDLGRDANLQIKLDAPAMRAQLWRMQAPSLGDTHHASLGGTQVAGDGTWAPREVENVAVTGDALAVNVPRASGALVWVD